MNSPAGDGTPERRDHTDPAPLSITGRSMSIAAMLSVAMRQVPVEFSADARRRIEDSCRFGTLTATRRPVYGRTTGVGANKSATLVNPDEQALDLLRSHATSVGARRAPMPTRAAVAVRLNQIAAGGSGISLDVAETLCRLLNDDALPAVRDGGRIGTGDLPVFAAIGVAMAGAPPASPYHATLTSGDALALISSNAATIADSALAIHDLQQLVTASTAIAALSHRALRGNLEAYSHAAELATPFPGAAAVFAALRHYLDGEPPLPPARLQDPFALRTIPQVHGPLVDAVSRFDAICTALANAPTENPLLLPDQGIAHHGGFHMAYLAQALDTTRSAVAQSAQLGVRRITMLTQPALSDQPAFLGDGTPGASGIMLLEYIAADALSSLRSAAAPMAVQSVSISHAVENDASFAPQGARLLADGIGHYRTILACELVAAVRSLRLSGQRPTAALAEIVARCRALPDDPHDRDLGDDLDIAARLVDTLATPAAP